MKINLSFDGATRKQILSLSPEAAGETLQLEALINDLQFNNVKHERRNTDKFVPTIILDVWIEENMA